MPTYCYETNDGDIVEREFDRGKAPEEITILEDDGVVTTLSRCYAAENPRTVVRGGTGGPTGQRKSGWPMAPCVASGVHPSQAQELRNHFKAHGLNVEVNQNGDPIYESASQRRAALKCRGMYDKSSYD